MTHMALMARMELCGKEFFFSFLYLRFLVAAFTFDGSFTHYWHYRYGPESADRVLLY